MSKTRRNNSFQPKDKRTSKMLFGLCIGLLASTQMSWGQQPIATGQFDGGFENAVLNSVVLSQTSPDATNWSMDSANLNGTAIKSITDAGVGVTNVRSGSKSIYYTTTAASGTGKYIMSPILNPALKGNEILPAPRYTVQYFTNNTTVGATKAGILIYTGGRGSNTGTVTTINNWNKITWMATAATAAAATTGTWAGFSTNIASVNGYVDDFVVYQPTVDDLLGFDTTNPDAATAPTVTALAVSWTAPTNGVDGGGYMVVRYASNPNADNDPNGNGIYAKGNTITNGTDALVGTVVYVGSATAFTDDVAGSVTGFDYYKIYTVDKAFNYSNEVTGKAAALGTNSFSKESDVTVYSKDKKILFSNIKSSTQVDVYDLTGALVKAAKTDSDSSLDLNSGIYIVKLKSAEGEKSVKIIVQ